MAELDERTVAAIRDMQGPGPATRDQMLASIWASIEGPDDPDDPDDPGGPREPGGPGQSAGPGGGQALWIAKIVGATMGLTGAGLAAIGLVGRLVAGPEAALEPVTAPDRAPVAVDEGSTTEAPSEILDADATPSPEPAALESSAPTRASEPRSRSANTSDRQAEAKPTPAPSDLNAELALLREAEALVRRDPHAALSRLERHRREHPEGVLGPEREVVRVEALCALGRDDEAARARDEFIEAHPSSPLTQRVSSACR